MSASNATTGQLFHADFEDGFEHKEGSEPLADDVQSLTTLADTQQLGQNVTTYKYEGKRYRIKSTETITHVAKHILRQNTSDGFTSVVFIGRSGTGKTTEASTTLHRLHTLAERIGVHYAISWYRRDAIGKIDEIIQSLPKGVNRIIVFDDASWGDRELDEKESQNLMARLTYVRHDLKANVIFVILIHYSKALGPFLRDGDVLFITSISHVEKENYLKAFGPDNRRIINRFFRKYGSMQSTGYWYSELNEVESIKHYTKRPFKISLCSDYNNLHFVQYPRESCGYCEPHFTDNLELHHVESASEKELLFNLKDSYGLTKLRQALRYFAYFRAGAQTLEPKAKSLMNRLIHYYEKHPEDWKSTLEELQTGRSIDYFLRKRGIAVRTTQEDQRMNKRAKAALKKREERLAAKATEQQQEQPSI